MSHSPHYIAHVHGSPGSILEDYAVDDDCNDIVMMMMMLMVVMMVMIMMMVMMAME